MSLRTNADAARQATGRQAAETSLVPGLPMPEAVRARIPLTTCARVLQPGVDPATFPAEYAAFVSYVGDDAGDAPEVPQEPALEPYAYR